MIYRTPAEQSEPDQDSGEEYGGVAPLVFEEVATLLIGVFGPAALGALIAYALTW